MNFPLKAFTQVSSRARGILLGLAFFVSGFVSAAPCDFVRPWKDAESRRPRAAKTVREYSDWMREVSVGIRASTENLYRSYRRGEVVDDDVRNCLALEGLADVRAVKEFFDAVPATFFRESVTELEKVRGPMSKKFSGTLAERSRRGELVLFRMVGHFVDAVSPSGDKAGFHRGTGSVFMDFSKIPAKEWLIVFAHEHAHRLDTALADAMPVFADAVLRARVAAMAEKTARPSRLSAEELRDLDRWLLAGLNRGFLAEVRAWALSFDIYGEGLASGAWLPIEWMETMLRERTPGEESIAFATRYLAPRFYDPHEESGLLTRPLVLNRLKWMRSRIGSGALPLAPILSSSRDE